ncbi:hypothetical protein AMECASPLE_006843 [Ameca splendens]|uniref:Secreted protein n=1 Tax=Ameca splendens TaxID=208324 RepID=A0ABV0ZWD0_9TELE
MLGLFKVFNGSCASICLLCLYIPPMCSVKSGSAPAEWYVNSTWPGPLNQPPFILKPKPPNNVPLCRSGHKKKEKTSSRVINVSIPTPFFLPRCSLYPSLLALMFLPFCERHTGGPDC